MLSTRVAFQIYQNDSNTSRKHHIDTVSRSCAREYTCGFSFNTHVAFQLTILTKLHLAHITFIRSLVRVNTHVDFQTTRMTKSFIAHIVSVRFLVRVNTHVGFQITRITKSFITNITFIRLLFRVRTHVGFQITRTTKTSSRTHRIRAVSLSCEYAHV